jgi:protein phosphatase
MEDEPAVDVPPAPRPRPFPAGGTSPGPRCGHTLTAIASSSDGLASARLVMFGEWIDV